jgi:hypothetical protein
MSKDDDLTNHVEMPDLLQALNVNYPWNVVAAYPRQYWEVLKTLHDRNIELEEEITRLRNALNSGDICQ